MQSDNQPENEIQTRTLPVPQRERWQPLRSGFVNLYRYDQEEFHYENGRLLLRGNNGTGKSRVLALQLPFLFDGEVIPQRLEPDADPARKVEWNLLMGRYPDRTGYTWIEFGRRNDQGEEHYVTLGCGLSAVEGQNGVRQWFFITPERIGHDLKLVNEAGQVLGKDRLRERLGDAGQLFEAVGLYRRAVNEALFHLDDYRYSSLVNLLIQLRRPQLTRRLYEEELSGALSEALRPVSPSVIAEVAEAFSNLESERNTLESFRTAMNAVEQFLMGYRTYAQAAARRRADRVWTAHQQYEAQMTEILAAEADCGQSLAELSNLKIEIAQLSADQYDLEAKIAALQQSPQMKDAFALERLHREARERRKDAEETLAELKDATQCQKARAEEHVRCMTTFEQHEARLTNATNAATNAAQAAGLDASHRQFIAALDITPSAVESKWKQARERIEAAIQVQSEKIEHMRRLNNRLVAVTTDVQQLSALKDQLSGLLDDARERLNTAQQEHVSNITSFLEAADEWRGNLTELRVAFEAAFLGAMNEWCESPQSFSPFDTAVRKAVNEVARSFAEQRVLIRHRQTIEMTEMTRLKEERENLASAANARASEVGASLWLLCDFAEGYDAEMHAGLEAALQASGLLNALVTPSGELIDPESHDVVLVPATIPLPPEDAHLGLMLVPRIHPPEAEELVPPYVVADILRHIGSKPNCGLTWVSVDGRWQNGILTGRGRNDVPQYIGRDSGEAWMQRATELDGAIAEKQERLDSIAISMTDLNRRERVARSEADAAPIDVRLRAAYEQAIAAAREVDGLRIRLVKTEEQLIHKRSELEQATQARDGAAIDLDIAKRVEDIDSLKEGLSTYRTSIAAFWLTLEAFLDAGRATESAWALVEEAKAREARLDEASARMDRAASTAQTRFESVKQVHGAPIDQILKQIDDAKQRLDDLKQKERDARQRHHDSELAVTRLDERLRNLTDMLNGHIERRDSAASALRAFAGTRLLHVAVSGIADSDSSAWTTARTVEVASQLAAKLDSIDSDDPTWELLQKSVPTQFNDLMQTLSAHDCQPTATFRDDVFVASALFGGQETTIEDLFQILSKEVTVRQVLMNAREKEILESHLVGEVPSHLHELLLAAEEHVQHMNIELESRPMSSGMKLRLVWRLVDDGESKFSEVRRRLVRPRDTWSFEDRQALGAFLQQQIHDVRSQMEAGTWQEALIEALDYRKWHRFGVERYQEGVWKRLTRRTHGTGSGGEKAVALTLPYFAAAAAFYRTADPLAPRLILLDEAFVGIDADMRAKCMGLIHTFDLDFVMTSEREWGCYRTLPGIAIYQLSTRPGIDAIGLTRWVWNGRQRSLHQKLSGPEEAGTVAAVYDRRES
jgi:uncharacterized protein (TIGR02680 family)